MKERMASPTIASRNEGRPEMFDLWLRRQLESAYGRVDQEPLSPELEALLGVTRH